MTYISGAYDTGDVVRTLNDVIGSYDSHPARDFSQEAVRQFWVDGDERSYISYYRGDLLGLYTDETLRSLSDGATSLDDLMLHFAAEAWQGNTKPKAEEVFVWLAENGSPELAQTVRRLALDGGPIPLPSRMTEPALILNAEGRYEPVPISQFVE